MQEKRGFFSTWFGFTGWRVMSAKAQIFTQILYRVIFLLGLGCLIAGYGYLTNEEFDAWVRPEEMTGPRSSE